MYKYISISLRRDDTPQERAHKNAARNISQHTLRFNPLDCGIPSNYFQLQIVEILRSGARRLQIMVNQTLDILEDC